MGGLRRPLLGVVIVALAFFLRGWRIGELPPGFLSDEAYNVVDVVEMLETGSRPLFFTRNNGREPLFLYLQAASVALLGPTPFAARVVAVFLGTLTVALLYRLARDLFGPGSWAPVVSSLVLAVTLYHAILSREGLRSISLPPLALVALIALWSAYRRG
ncbi:MAG TPA: glycosyltransferase family 39 protein, partial [Dehalococcoidia bacterium]|nr:glycosyltransferase family 39 protein [Dehalococcoidia bacterium]